MAFVGPLPLSGSVVGTGEGYLPKQLGGANPSEVRGIEDQIRSAYPGINPAFTEYGGQGVNPTTQGLGFNYAGPDLFGGMPPTSIDALLANVPQEISGAGRATPETITSQTVGATPPSGGVIQTGLSNATPGIDRIPEDMLPNGGRMPYNGIDAPTSQGRIGTNIIPSSLGSGGSGTIGPGEGQGGSPGAFLGGFYSQDPLVNQNTVSNFYNQLNRLSSPPPIGGGTVADPDPNAQTETGVVPASTGARARDSEAFQALANPFGALRDALGLGNMPGGKIGDFAGNALVNALMSTNPITGALNLGRQMGVKVGQLGDLVADFAFGSGLGSAPSGNANAGVNPALAAQRAGERGQEDPFANPPPEIRDITGHTGMPGLPGQEGLGTGQPGTGSGVAGDIGGVGSGQSGPAGAGVGGPDSGGPGGPGPGDVGEVHAGGPIGEYHFGGPAESMASRKPISAKLLPGEYVINPYAAKKYKALLDQINNEGRQMAASQGDVKSAVPQDQVKHAGGYTYDAGGVIPENEDAEEKQLSQQYPDHNNLIWQSRDRAFADYAGGVARPDKFKGMRPGHPGSQVSGGEIAVGNYDSGGYVKRDPEVNSEGERNPTIGEMGKTLWEQAKRGYPVIKDEFSKIGERLLKAPNYPVDAGHDQEMHSGGSVSYDAGGIAIPDLGMIPNLPYGSRALATTSPDYGSAGAAKASQVIGNYIRQRNPNQRGESASLSDQVRGLQAGQQQSQQSDPWAAVINEL